MDSFFSELGRTVLERWKERNFSPAAFPGIACAVLEERPPAEHVDVAALVRQFLLDDGQPFQTQSSFGEPELVAYDDPRFYIQILFWLEGTMEIHQHQFSGAFHVMQGSSLHSHFEFVNSKAVTAHFRVGDLRLKDTRLLETGSTVPIVSGPACIHSLFHLDTPSLSVVIRTHNDPGTGPQFSYLPPHLAVDPFHHDALTGRRKQLLDVLENLGDPAYPDLVLAMIGNLDFERGFFILQNGMGHLRNLGRWEEAWDIFRRKHGALARYVRPTLDEIVWREGPVGFRNSITDPDHRFFLALLLNVPSRTDILGFVAQRYPGKAVQTVMGWVDELSDSTELGTWILDAEFPEQVKVPGPQQGEVFFAALEWFLKGGKGSAKFGALSPTAKDIKRLREAFARSSLRALVS